MARTGPFDAHADQYEKWFTDFTAVYDTEVKALKKIMPGRTTTGLEIGAGSGLFASRLGVQYGVDPSNTMVEKAKTRGITMKIGTAEQLPYPDESFDYTLMVTSLCYVDDLDMAMQEMKRVLKPGGWVLFGFVDQDSPLGQIYQKFKDKSVFYRPATFYSVSEVDYSLRQHGFTVETIRQTVFGSIKEITEIQESKEGHGEGGFVVLRASK